MPELYKISLVTPSSEILDFFLFSVLHFNCSQPYDRMTPLYQTYSTKKCQKVGIIFFPPLYKKVPFCVSPILLWKQKAVLTKIFIQEKKGICRCIIMPFYHGVDCTFFFFFEIIFIFLFQRRWHKSKKTGFFANLTKSNFHAKTTLHDWKPKKKFWAKLIFSIFLFFLQNWFLLWCIWMVRIFFISWWQCHLKFFLKKSKIDLETKWWHLPIMPRSLKTKSCNFF